MSDRTASSLAITHSTQPDSFISADISSSGSFRVTVAADISATALLTVMPSVSQLDLTIDVGQHADVQLVILQFGHQQLTISQDQQVAAHAHLKTTILSLHQQQLHHDLHSYLQGQHARSDVDWAFYAGGTDQQTVTAYNYFQAPDCTGEIMMKGVAQEQAYVKCDGMINISLQGTNTDAYLTQDVLMLDSSAKVDAIPGLEIKTNDVKASHSATVSQVTPEDLFYFASRGIDEKTARTMYIDGFLQSLVFNIASDELRTTLISQIEAAHTQ